LLHLPTSTVVPFGMSVSTSLLVPAALRKLVSAVVVMGLAVAHVIETNVATAADAAIRVKTKADLFDMAILFDHSIVSPPGTV